MKKQNNYYNVRATIVPMLPDVVNYDSIKNELNARKDFILGIENENLTYYKYNINSEFATVVTGNDIELISKFTNSIIGELLYLNYNKLFIVNSEGMHLQEREDAIIINNDFNAFFEKINDFISVNYKKYEDNSFNKSIFENTKPLICIIIGSISFKEGLNKASVSLTFDNSDNYLHTEFKEIEIKRCIYKNGDNDYYLNNSKVRLKDITEMPGIEKGARWHHERYDGKGYPDGIKGEEIPEFSRIICVADAYDAMTSTRSYRDILPQEKVRSEIVKGRGTQFDPKYADIMIELIDQDKDYKMRG